MKRIKGQARRDLATDARERYGRGESIRAIGEALDLRYGLTRRLLLEAGVDLRGRGGPRKAKAQGAGEVAS